MIFIDTGAFLARYIERDQYHDSARRYWAILQASGRRCFTSNLVLAETITLLARRAGNPFATERAHAIYASAALTVLRPLGEDETAAPQFMEKFADQGVSFTDCVSFALMSKHRIETAFTFDHHFRIAGFHVEP